MEVSKYFNNDIINDKSILSLLDKYKYVDDINKKINSIESDYNNLITEINNINNIDDYVNKISNNKCLTLIRQELKIIKLLSKYTLQNNKFNEEFMLKCLNIILKISEILRTKLNQQELKSHKKFQRGSYKFCDFKENCKYYYENKHKKCYQDHYVHNMVSRDVKLLISYLSSDYNSKEILKSINTLSYVINHMELELGTKCKYYDESEWDMFHCKK